ncbi:MAG: hypothetical protein RBU25_05700 [Lentisphaeria bacterium]|nr:hypothetical protein [Lentisphaeria bacterium]
MTPLRHLVLAAVLISGLFAHSLGPWGGVPVSTLVLLGGLALLLAKTGSRPVPWLPLPLALGALALACGVFGTGRGELATTLKQLVQIGEITLAAVYLTQFGIRREIRAALVWWLGGLGLVLLALPLAGGLDWLDLSPAKWGAFATLAAPFLVLLIGRKCPWAGILPGLLAGMTFPHAGPLLVWCAVVVFAGHVCGRCRWPSLLIAAVALAVSLQPGRRDIWERLNPDYDGLHRKRSVIETGLALRSPYHLPLGAGLGQYRAAINQLRAFGAGTPHPEDTKVPRDGNCQFLVTLVESGPIGLAGLAGLLVAGLVAAWRREPGETAAEFQERRTVAVALTGALGASLFSLTFSRGIGIWLGLLLGLSFAPCRLLPVPRRLFILLGCWGGIAGLLGIALLVNAVAGEQTWPSRANRLVAKLYRADIGGEGPRVVVFPDPLAGAANSTLTVEAETAFEVMPPFRVVPADGASGGAALAIPDGRGKGIGRATVNLTVPEPGRYLLFARVYWADGCANSIGFRLSGQEIRLADEIYQRWHHIEDRTPIELPAGTLQLQIVNLEDGVMVDYVGLRAAE